MTDEDKRRENSIKRQIWSLVVARFAFQEVSAACKWYFDAGYDQKHPLYPILISGIVITYTKAFTDSKTLPKLGSEFETYNNAQLSKTHKALLEARNTIYAHTDVRQSITLSFHVRLDADGLKYRSMGSRKSLSSIVLVDVLRLCDLQVERINKKLAVVIRKLFPTEKILRLLKAERSPETTLEIILPTHR